jgi:hypothetical protein
MKSLNKLLACLIAFCINGGIMVIVIGLMGYYKGTLHNVNPLGATIDNFALFGIAVTLMIGSVAFWLVRLIAKGGN